MKYRRQQKTKEGGNEDDGDGNPDVKIQVVAIVTNHPPG